MSYLRSLLRRLFRPAPTSRGPVMEGLEGRQFLSGSPAVTGIHLSGQLRAITAVTFTFDSPLDPTSAENIQGYQFGRVIPAGSSDNSGFDLGSILGLLAKPKTPLIKNYRVQFTSAVYDDATQSVTLTPVRPFNGLTWFRFIRVLGVGNNAIKDVSGTPLNGGSNTYVHWFAHIGKQFVYRDADGDLVTVGLRGPGNMVAFLQTNTEHSPTIFVLNGRPNSVLTGHVLQARTGDGVAIIPEVQGVSAIQPEILTNPQFDVRTTEP